MLSRSISRPYRAQRSVKLRALWAYRIVPSSIGGTAIREGFGERW